MKSGRGDYPPESITTYNVQWDSFMHFKYPLRISETRFQHHVWEPKIPATLTLNKGFSNVTTVRLSTITSQEHITAAKTLQKIHYHNATNHLQLLQLLDKISVISTDGKIGQMLVYKNVHQRGLKSKLYGLVTEIL